MDRNAREIARRASHFQHGCAAASRALAVFACLAACGRSGVEALDDAFGDDETAPLGSGGTGAAGGTAAGARSTGGSGTSGGRGGSAGAPGGTSSLGGAGTGGAGSGGLGEAGEAPCATFDPGADRESPWSFGFGDDTYQQGSVIVSAADGSSYVAGAFQGALDLGGGVWQSDTGGDAFVVRLDPTGRTLFGLHFRGGASTRVRAMALTSDGTLVVSGAFSGSVDFGAARLVAGGVESAFLLGIDACGRVIQARSFGGGAASIDAVRPVGDGFVASGWFTGAIDVGGGRWENLASEPHAFVARYDRAFEPIWTREVSGARRLFLSADEDKNVYVASELRGFVDLGSAGSLSGTGRAFVVKLDPRGTPLWAVSDVAERNDGKSWTQAITVDPAGHVIVLVSLIDGSVDFGGSLQADWVCCGDDELALSIHPDGTPLWLTLIDHYVSIQIAATSTGFVAVTSDAGAVGFELKNYDVSGTLLGARGFGFASYVDPFDIAFDDAESLLVTGSFRGSLDLGSGALEPTEGFDWDGFVARLPANALDPEDP